MQHTITTCKLESIQEEPTQTAAAEQRALERMVQYELDEIHELEMFRQNISAIRCIIESGIADFNNSPAQPQSPIRVGLVKSRVCQTWVDPKVGYFHPVLNEWRPFPSEERTGDVKHKSWFRITNNIKAKYLKMRSGLKKSDANRHSISLPIYGSLVF